MNSLKIKLVVSVVALVVIIFELAAHVFVASFFDGFYQVLFRESFIVVLGVVGGVVTSFLYAGSITKSLKVLREGISAIAKGDFSHRVNLKNKDEFSLVADEINGMAKKLKGNTKKTVEDVRVANEVEIAAGIQKDLLPKEIPIISGMDISAGLLPSDEIGCDIYDFIKPDENTLLMYMGDVTGHGVSAGMVAAMANALICNYSSEPDLKVLLMNVNRVLKNRVKSNRLMTMSMLRFDSSIDELKYVSAGHEPMIHFHSKYKKVTQIPNAGVALGMLNDISESLKEDVINMESGDVLVVYSDGIPECKKNENEIYGLGRLKRAVNDYSDLPTAFAIRNALLADVKEFAGKYKQLDDIALIVLKKK
jgi:phosphoserine phosphatase RsbU/P